MSTLQEDRETALIKQGAEIARRRLEEIEHRKQSQPTRIAEARAQADDERAKALDAEPWVDVMTGIPTVDAETGELSGVLGMPSIDGNEVFGTRLAFDLLSYGGDEDRVSEIMSDYFAMIREPGHMFLVCAAALETIANYVVPALLDTLERQASDYDARVRLVDAARNAWAGRVEDLYREGSVPS